MVLALVNSRVINEKISLLISLEGYSSNFRNFLNIMGKNSLSSLLLISGNLRLLQMTKKKKTLTGIGGMGSSS